MTNLNTATVERPLVGCFPTIGKKPATNGQSWQTWTQGKGGTKQYGIAIPDGRVVIDADFYKPDCISEAELAEHLGITTGELALALIQTTQNGGKHFAFVVPDGAGIVNATGLWPGIDVRSAGLGYICSGRGYTVDSLFAETAEEAIAQASIELRPDVLRRSAPVANDDLSVMVANQPDDGVSLDELSSTLNAIKDDSQWFTIACAVHHQTEGSEAGYALFDAWSKQFPERYDSRNNRKRWDSIRSDKGNPITIGTLKKLAAEVAAPTMKKARGFQLVNGFSGFDASISYTIKNMLPSESFSVIYGPSGSFKSFVAMAWACHVATGTPWDGRKVDQGAVLYVVAEGGIGAPRRLKAWADQYHGGNEIPNLYRIQQAVFTADANQVEDLIQACRHIETETGQPVKMVVFDTLARCFGGADENKSADMGAFISGCDAVKVATKASVVVVHHSGKDEVKGARGSSALRAACDAEFFVTREAKTGNAAVIECTKQKDAEQGGRTAYDLTTRILFTDTDGQDVTSLALIDIGREPLDVMEDEPFTKNHRNLLNAIECLGGKATWAEVVEKMQSAGTYSKNATRWRDRLINDGTITKNDIYLEYEAPI